MKMANNLLPVIEKLARQKQKTNSVTKGQWWGKGGTEEKRERNRHRNDNCKNSFK